MMSSPLIAVRRAALLLAVFAASVVTAASPADARVFIGIGIPFYGPGFYPAPYYYPPPVYYPPPPVVYAPPAPAQNYSQAPAPLPEGSGQMCYAGAYTCPMDRPVASGSGCYCLGNGGQRVSGRAN